MPDSTDKDKLPPSGPAAIDGDYLREILLKLLSIHSPTGYTDPIVREVCRELDNLGVKYELTRRGAIRAHLPGKTRSPDRAVVTHLDTLGAMVKELKPNGRLRVTPIGTWSARFAEGARVSIFTDNTAFRGTLLPLKASGHTFDDAINSQPVCWDNIELRVDAPVFNEADLRELGIQIGDFIGIDSAAEVSRRGYINARHLDNKGGVAAKMAAMQYIIKQSVSLPVDCHMLFTISEEVGSGASAVLHGDVAEMVSVDNGTCAPGQASSEFGVTIAMADSTGPFDYHLTHHLLYLCKHQGISTKRDIFTHYRCDSASAVEAGNDIRTALVTFGVDASHGYERTHFDSLRSVASLIVAYASSPPVYFKQAKQLGPLRTFPQTRTVDIGRIDSNPSQTIAQKPPEED